MTCKQESLLDDNGDYLCISEEIRSVTAERESTLQRRSYHQIDGEKANLSLPYLVCPVSLHPGDFMKHILLGKCTWQLTSDNEELYKRLFVRLTRILFRKFEPKSSCVKSKKVRRYVTDQFLPSTSFLPTYCHKKTLPSDTRIEHLQSPTICSRCSNLSQKDCVLNYSHSKTNNTRKNSYQGTFSCHHGKTENKTKEYSHRKRNRYQSSNKGNKLSSFSIKFWILAFAIQQM